MSSPRIAVVGAGANGASIGADLTVAGHDVDLIEQWPEHVAAMRADGIRIEMPDETITVPVRAFNLCDVATLTRRYEVVLIVMKAYDTGWAARLIEPLVRPDGLVVGVQNGMSTFDVADAVGDHRTLGSVIEISSMMTDPGVVHRHSPPSRSWFAVGSITTQSSGREAEVADLLGHSGQVDIVEDIQATKWMKLVSNTTTLVTTAILGEPILGAVELPGMRELMIRAGEEARSAGELLGYPLLPIFGLRLEDMGSPDTLVERLLDTLLAGFVLPETTTTILHDWLKGRHSEVDDINGRVVTALTAAGGRAPVNSAVVEIAHRIERRELAPGPENLELFRDLVARDIDPSPRFA